MVNAVAERPLPRLGETGGSLGVVGPMKGDDTTLRLTGDNHDSDFWN